MPGHPDRPVVLVTGAARRIGAEIARELHAAGCDLALHYRRSQADADALCAELEARRADSVIAVQAELSASAQLPLLVEVAVGRFGRLDGLVNNASAFFPTPLAEVSARQWDDLLAVNARAPFLLATAAAPHLRAARGAIVNITDFYADHPQADFIPYAASKAAMVAVTRGLARALAPAVRVNAVAPGAMSWPEAGLAGSEKAAILAATPLGRTGEPRDIATTVRWLLLEAAFVTGEVIHVDGGRTLAR